jgi:hypothetical protein
MKKNFLVPFLFFVLSLSFISCSKEGKDKSEVYDLIVKEINTMLKAPSSAKFQKQSQALISINYNDDTLKMSEWVSKDNPDLYLPTGENPQIDNMRTTLLKSIDKKNGKVIVDFATVKIKVSAQNSFGVFLEKTWFGSFNKPNYSDGSKGEWKVIYIAPEEE